MWSVLTAPVPVDVRSLASQVPVLFRLLEERSAGSAPAGHLKKVRHLVSRQGAGRLEIEGLPGEDLRQSRPSSVKNRPEMMDLYKKWWIS